MYVYSTYLVQLGRPARGWIDPVETAVVGSTLHAALIDMYKTHGPTDDVKFDAALKQLEEQATEVYLYTYYVASCPRDSF